MLKKILNFIISLKFILKPQYWIMNYNYSKEWDIELNRLLELHTFRLISSYRATLGDTEIWIANHPYASFVIHGNVRPIVRPSRLTIERTHKKLLQDIEIPRRSTTYEHEIEDIRRDLDMLKQGKSVYSKKDDLMDKKTIKKFKLYD